MITYTFSDFPYTDKPIIIPKHAIFYRGISKGKNIAKLNVLRSDVPIYVGSIDVAKSYSHSDRDLFFKLQAKKDLKLIDIRKVISLLPLILNKLDINESNKNIINLLKVVLGITTLNEQIEITKTLDGIPADRIKSLEEFLKTERFFNLGVRIPITNLDSTMVLILKQIFSNYFDGVIAPKLITPFDPSGKSHEEIILFEASNLEILDGNNNIDIVDIISILDGTKTIYLNMETYSGGTTIKSDYIDKNELFLNKKWLDKTSKLIKQSFEKISIKPELWNNSKHRIEKHLDYVYMPGSEIKNPKLIL
jgi:hypothetical protein